MFRVLTLLLLAAGELLADLDAEGIANELASRYIPYVGEEILLGTQILASELPTPRWSTPDEIRTSCPDAVFLAVREPNVARNSTPACLPLIGLRLALDPGHIGGMWADWEARSFRMSIDDCWVREGELVLEVAQRVQVKLKALGAEVILLRNSTVPLNPIPVADYWALAAKEFLAPSTASLEEQIDYALAIRERAVHMAVVTEELIERARIVNEVIRPDALISLHINAASWSKGEQQLVDSDHSHVLIFGCMSAAELAMPGQQDRLFTKLINGSGPIEVELATALGRSLAEATGLPASEYEGENAIRVNADVPEVWARNLMLLRLVDCPTVMLEPYIANSKNSYARLQNALVNRTKNFPVSEDDILVEYADAVVDGVLRAYGR